jgi:hypothetical protein
MRLAHAVIVSIAKPFEREDAGNLNELLTEVFGLDGVGFCIDGPSESADDNS